MIVFLPAHYTMNSSRLFLDLFIAEVEGRKVMTMRDVKRLGIPASYSVGRITALSESSLLTM